MPDWDAGARIRMFGARSRPVRRDPGWVCGYAGASRLATWRMSGEPVDSCTLRVNSHCRTRPASIPAMAAIRAASPPGSAASRSWQFSMCCSRSQAGSPAYGFGVDDQPGFALHGQDVAAVQVGGQQHQAA